MQARYRLTHNSAFNYIYRNGQSAANRYMIIFFTKTRYFLKAGFSVSKKIGNSVERNRTKRRLRESFRALIPRLNQKYNYVIVARDGAKTATYAELSDAMKRTLQKAGLIVGGQAE